MKWLSVLGLFALERISRTRANQEDPAVRELLDLLREQREEEEDIVPLWVEGYPFWSMEKLQAINAMAAIRREGSLKKAAKSIGVCLRTVSRALSFGAELLVSSEDPRVLEGLKAALALPPMRADHLRMWATGHLVDAVGVTEAAEVLKVSRTTIYAWQRRGEASSVVREKAQ